jgi:hypothetical protein
MRRVRFAAYPPCWLPPEPQGLAGLRAAIIQPLLATSRQPRELARLWHASCGRLMFLMRAAEHWRAMMSPSVLRGDSGALVKLIVRTVGVVVADVLATTRRNCRLSSTRRPHRYSRRSEPRKRSQVALMFGARTAVQTMRMPSGSRCMPGGGSKRVCAAPLVGGAIVALREVQMSRPSRARARVPQMLNGRSPAERPDSTLAK